MWVLTDDGALINLDHIVEIRVGMMVTETGVGVWADQPGMGESEGYEYGPNPLAICTCDDEEHGKRIIGELARTINVTPKGSIRVIVMDQIKKRAKAGGESS